MNPNLWTISREQLAWMKRLSGKLLLVSPKESSFSVAIQMVSEILLLLAFLLPLKVILLVAQDGVPWYLGPWLDPSAKDEFIVLLAFGAIASYGLHHLANFIVRRLVRSGTTKALSNTQKLLVFENQDQLAEQGYLTLVRAEAAATFVLLGFAGGLYLNPFVFSLLLAIATFEYVLLIFMLRYDVAQQRWIDQVCVEKPGVVANVASSVNFLVVFSLLLIQLLDEEELSVVIAILSIIVSRQILQRGASLVGDIAYLRRNREKLAALFFSSERYHPPENKRHIAFQEFLKPDSRNLWLVDSLSAVLSEPIATVTSKSIDTGRPHLAYFDVATSTDAAGNGEATSGRYFVKCWDSANNLRANHESQLLSGKHTSIPIAPVFIGTTTTWQQYRVSVFEGLETERIAGKAWKDMIPRVFFEAWASKLDKDLVQSYLRTHSTVSGRITDEMLTQLGVGLESDDEIELWESLSKEWIGICEAVNKAPLVIRNPAMANPKNWVMNASGEPVCLDWGMWSIEPIGCERSLIRQPAQNIESCTAWWNSIADQQRQVVSARQVELVAFTFELEDALRKRDVRRGLEAASEILERWNRLEPDQATATAPKSTCV